nr:FtsW/RodA/SpoVE family cell cycle protein [Clostridium ganghwense]
MGDAEEVGKQLNLAHKGTPDLITLILTLVLVNIGVVLMYFMENSGLLRSTEYMFNNSIKYALAGTASVILLYYFDYRKLEKYSNYMFIGFFMLCVFLMSIGTTMHGQVVIYIGDYPFNFIDVSPYVFIIALAGIFNNWDWSRKINLIKAFAYLICPMIIMFLGVSLTSCGIYFVAFIVLAVKSGLNKKYAFLLIGFNIMIFVMCIFTEPYRIKRFFAFLHPLSDPRGNTYTNSLIYNIIHSSGMFGHGKAFLEYSFPGIHSEYIFNYIVYTFGWIGAAVLITLIIAFIMRILHITNKIHDGYGKLLISGLVSIFIVQYLLNILINVNLAPTVSVTLPFISYGGAMCLFNMISVGIILSVYRRRSLSVNNNKSAIKN